MITGLLSNFDASRFIKALFLLGCLIISVPSLGNEIDNVESSNVLTNESANCADNLSQLSFEKVIDEYAELIHAAENSPPNSTIHIVLLGALESKAEALSKLVTKKDLDATKEKITQKLTALRSSGEVQNKENNFNETASRDEEAQYLNFEYRPQTKPLGDMSFRHGELSPDGKYFLMIQKVTYFKVKLSLISISDGKPVFEKKYFDTLAYAHLRTTFLGKGKYLRIDYDLTSFLSVALDIGFVIRDVKIVETSTGRLLQRKHSLEKDTLIKNGLNFELSDSGRYALISKNKKVKVVDLISKRSSTFKLSGGHFLEAWFDASEENLTIREVIKGTDRNFQKISSYKIKTKKLNWTKVGSSFGATKDGKFIFMIETAAHGIEVGALLDGNSGALIRQLPGTDLDIQNAYLSQDSKLIFIPQEFHASGYIYHLDPQIPAISLDVNIPHTMVTRAHFFNQNTRLAVINERGKLFVWDVEQGTLLKRLPGKYTFYGLDADENILGSSETSLHEFEDLQTFVKQIP